MTDDIPALQRPEDTPPIRSQADLLRQWRALMGGLGFDSAQLFIAVLDADRRFTPAIHNIVELPDVPDTEAIDGLMTLCRMLLEEVFPGGSAAFLFARPGPAGLTAADRAWASRLVAAAAEHDVPAHPVHLANDHEVQVFAPDDQIASA